MDIDTSAFFSLCVIDEAGGCKDITSGGALRDNLVDSLRQMPSGLCCASFFGSVANVPTSQLYIPPADEYDDD